MAQTAAVDRHRSAGLPGVVHLDDLQPVGVIRFQQPSGLPVLSVALAPANVEAQDAYRVAMPRSPAAVDALPDRWWTLRSDSLEILPTGTWRVMATLTVNGTAGPVELFLEVDPAASSPGWLVLGGHGLLDRCGFWSGDPASTFSRQIRLDLAVRARRVGAHLHLTNRPAEVAAQGPMHRVAAPTGPHPPDAGTTAAPQLPIGRYRRTPVQVHQADPHAPQVARRLIALIATGWPATPAEHIGSTAVPGLAGKGIIDLLLTAEPTDIPAITKALLDLGFQPQVPAAFPPTRPMLWGTFRHRATTYPVHVHVVPAGSPEVAAMRGLRDALGADPVLRRRYAALKRAIVRGGPVDPVAFTRAKHDWIAATLAHLGLADEQPRRLYQDDLNQDSSRRLAARPTHPSPVPAGSVAERDRDRQPAPAMGQVIDREPTIANHEEVLDRPCRASRQVDDTGEHTGASAGTAELVARAGSGDQVAWDQLVARYGGLVWAVARAHGLSPRDASQVSQVTWLLLTQHLGALRQPERLGSWLLGTATREASRMGRLRGCQVPSPTSTTWSAAASGVGG
jgi:GrpB-like predicted nucleotidyltransferase (UPF0157 family)